MGLVETANYSLDTYIKGEPDAEGLALVLPGFLDTKDRSYLKHHVDYLARLGYLAMSFDPPGTWGSSGNIEDYTATNYLGAIDELIEHFGNRPTFEMGHSLGGRMAILSGARNPNIHSLAAIMTVFDYIREDNYESRVTKWRTEGKKVFRIDSPSEPGRVRQFELPYSYSADAQLHQSHDDLNTLAMPKLFIAGRHDRLVTPAEALATYDMVGAPKELRWLNAGHYYGERPAFVGAVNRMIGSFLRGLPETRPGRMY